MEADKASLMSALLACQSRADLRQLRGMVSPSFPFITLACKHNRADLLHFLLDDDTASFSDRTDVVDPRWCSVEQEYEGHDAVYYTIRSSNVELLSTLLGSVTPELSERLVSESYEKLMFNNVFVSKEMHVFIQYTLHDLRFFSKGDEEIPSRSFANNNIEERIQMLMENTAEIITYKEVDSHFLYTARFIAQNIHILKQQLKSTYDRLPWEEMEFCLVSFVSAHIRRKELNIFYLSILRKDSLLKELDKFVSDVQELKEHIGLTDIQNLRKPIKLGREGVAATISIRYPHLYADYKELRDVSSLHIMKTHLDAALLADSATRVGQLTIKRALQVTGEHLKNTLDSPKLSPAVSELLLLSAPKETKIILQHLRNSLSHPHLESGGSLLYSNIQNDIKKLSSVINDITYFKKVNKIQDMLKMFIDSDSIVEYREIINVLKNVHYDTGVQKSDTDTKDRKNIEDLISKIQDQTPYEKKLVNEIKDVLNQTKFQYHLTSYDYRLLKNIYTRSVYDFSTESVGIRDMKDFAGRILENFPSQKNQLEFEKHMLVLGSLLTKFYNIVYLRIKPEIVNEITFAIARINYARSIDKDINCIDDYSRQLEEILPKIKKGKNALTSEEMIKIDKQLDLNFTELESILGTSGKSCQLYKPNILSLKDDINNRFVVEALVLDIMTLLDSSNRVPNNVLYLDGETPLLNGKCLRNHLAHGNALVDILPTDAWFSVLLNAVKLTESKYELLNCKIGNILKHNIKQLRRRYERGLSILDKQKEMWKSLLDGNFENFTMAIAGGADIYSRKEDLSSTLHHAARGNNIETIVFLTKQKMINTEVRDVNGQTPLHIAAAFGCDVIVKFLVVEMENSIDQVDDDGKTPLHLASQNGHTITVLTLLLLGAKITVIDKIEYSPLHYAVQGNYLEVVKILSEKQDSSNENTITNSFTPLHIAAGFGHLKLVSHLLLNEADVNPKTNQGTFPLHLAARNGHLEIVNTLLEKGAHVNLRDYRGRSSLLYAVENSHEEIVKTLLLNGAFVNNGDYETNSTPLHIAAYKGNRIIVHLLLQYNANVNDETKDGLTPLLIAANGENADVVHLLLQKGALVDSRNTRDMDSTALHFAAYFGHTSVVETLINEWQADIHIQDKNKHTPLHLAAQGGHLRVVDILLDHGANVHSVNIEGSTALHLSARNGHDVISEALIQKGSEVNCTDKSLNTPLHVAATKTCNEKTIQILLKHGANVNETGEIKRTALHIASLVGDGPMIETMLQKGADVNAKDNEGTTALHMAVYGNHKVAVEILLEDEYKAKVNLLDNTNSSALCCAARNNNKVVLDKLIKKGADVNVGGGKPLLTAVMAGHRLIVEALLKNKNVDINIKDQNGFNLLYAAALNGDELIATVLIKGGIKVANCIQNPSPLITAIKYGHKEFVKVLIENGADLNPTDPNFLPLHYAVLMNRPDIVEMLLLRGANSNNRDSNNRTPLELAVTNGQMKNTSLLLQQQGVRIDEWRNDNNRTLLHIAAKVGSLEITTLLVHRGADINAKDRLGFKPIHIAARHGHHNILAFFLDLGISIDNPGSNGYTLMHCAMMGRQLAVAEYLIDKHADINSTDLNGSMPIHCSAEQGYIEMVKLLLQSGALYDARDNLDRTPAELTENRDIKDVFESIGKLFNAVKHNNVLKVAAMVEDLANYVDVKSSVNATLLHIASWKGFQQVCDILLKNKANPNIVGKGGNSPLHYAAKYSHPGLVKSLLKNGAAHNLKADNTKTPLDFATQKDIQSLLQLIALCFQKVRSCNVTVIEDINTIINEEIIKAVMKARDTDGDTLVVVAVKNNFPDTDKLTQVSQADVLEKLSIANSMIISERFIEALDILKQLLDKRIEILGEDNPGTLDFRFIIAQILLKQTKYSEALPMLEYISKRMEKIGPDYLDNLKVRGILAMCLRKQGRIEEAWDILQDVMSKQQELLGKGHVQLMKTKYLAGLVLHDLRKYEEAFRLSTQAYTGLKKTLGAHHPDTLSAQNHIAGMLLIQGKHHEALAMFQTIYEVKVKTLGPNNSSILRTRRSIAIVLKVLNELDEAMSVVQDILAIQKNVLGLYHEDTTHTQILMTELYKRQHNFYDSLKVHKEGLVARNAIFGPNQPDCFLDLDRRYDNYEIQLKSRTGIEFIFVHPSDANFLVATRKGDISEVCRLIENGSDVFTVDDEGRTALHFATTVEVTELLLDSGADATAVSQKGNTPLHLATHRTCQQMVLLLLQNVKKTKPKTYHKFINTKTVVGGSTALHVAVKKGAADIVSCLLEHGACYNSRDRSDNHTPLQCSSSLSVTRLLRLAEEVFEMAERGGTELPQGDERHLVVVLNSRDTEHRTPLQLALVNGHIATARLFARLLRKHSINLHQGWPYSAWLTGYMKPFVLFAFLSAVLLFTFYVRLIMN